MEEALQKLPNLAPQSVESGLLDAMDEEFLARVRDEFCAKQEEILLGLKRYARSLLNGSPDAYGFTDDDVIGEAIRRTLDPTCKRNWNPDKCDLATYLRGVVSSILSNKDLWKKRDQDPVDFRALVPEKWNEKAEECGYSESRAQLQFKAIEETIEAEDDLDLVAYYVAVREGAKDRLNNYLDILISRFT